MAMQPYTGASSSMVGSYGQAFEKHEQDLRQSKDRLQKLRNALTEASNLSGWNSQNYRIESNFIQAIVEDVFIKLNPSLKSFGMEFRTCTI
ncbi:hypothetical protein P8452_21181 [Trifolium repens]|nr:hypothetical protein P8452_21181 [Trifolium repens]